MYAPHLNMPGSSFAIFVDKPKYERILAHDVAVVQRCCTQNQLDFITTMRKLGMKIIYDLDDQIWAIPKYNPAYSTLMPHREGFTACIRYTDLVTVSTATLAKAVRSHVKDLTNKLTHKEIPVVVAENRIDQRIFATPIPAEKMVVGWAGSSSHIGDLPVLVPAIQELATKHPDVTFEFRGCNPAIECTNADMPQEQKDMLMGLYKLPNFVHKFWTPVAEYNSRMPCWRWGIALAPVQEEDFNDSKSNIKMVEAGYCGIPCLASWARPYEEFCYHDRELQWLLCASQSSWLRKMRELINDSARREDLGRRMQMVTNRYYSWNKPHEGWQKAMELLRAL